MFSLCIFWYSVRTCAHTHTHTDKEVFISLQPEVLQKAVWSLLKDILRYVGCETGSPLESFRTGGNPCLPKDKLFFKGRALTYRSECLMWNLSVASLLTDLDGHWRCLPLEQADGAASDQRERTKTKRSFNSWLEKWCIKWSLDQTHFL